MTIQSQAPSSRNGSFIFASAAEALLHAARRYPLLTGKAEEAMIKRAQEGDKRARDHVVMSNLRYVAKLVRSYSLASHDFSDRVQDGSVAIMHAIDDFDPERGTFKTHLKWKVRQTMTSAIRQRSHTVRLPTDVLSARNKVQRAFERLSQDLGRSASPEEISSLVPNTPLSIIRQCLNAPTLSHTPFDERTDHARAPNEVLADAQYLRPDRALTARIMVEELQQARQALDEALVASSMPERDKEIFRTFYDLDGSLERRTFRETSRICGLTFQRVQQIVEKCWNTLAKKKLALTKERMENILDELGELEDLTHERIEIN